MVLQIDAVADFPPDLLTHRHNRIPWCRSWRWFCCCNWCRGNRACTIPSLARRYWRREHEYALPVSVLSEPVVRECPRCARREGVKEIIFQRTRASKAHAEYAQLAWTARIPWMYELLDLGTLSAYRKWDIRELVVLALQSRAVDILAGLHARVTYAYHSPINPHLADLLGFRVPDAYCVYSIDDGQRGVGDQRQEAQHINKLLLERVDGTALYLATIRLMCHGVVSTISSLCDLLMRQIHPCRCLGTMTRRIGCNGSFRW